jgi:2'-hydroxyisoflavone reductase
VLRPGYIAGPDDNSDRFTYWPACATRGGEMLAPDGPGDAIQFIDVRDLARFTLDIVENNVVGTFNVISPPGPFTIGDLLTASSSGANALAKPPVAPRPVWVPPDLLQRHNVALATDMPIWSDPTGADAAFARVSIARALQGGFLSEPSMARSATRSLGICSVASRNGPDSRRASIRRANTQCSWHGAPQRPIGRNKRARVQDVAARKSTSAVCCSEIPKL